MKSGSLVLFATLALTATTAAATSPADVHIDSLKTSHRVISFGKGEMAPDDSVRKLIDAFYYDQFRHSQEPDAPYFLFMSKDATLAMGIGGRLSVRGWYDWGGYAPGSSFVPADIPITPDPADMHALNASVSQSRIYFKILGNHRRLGNYQVYVEGKFNGSGGRGFQLSKAYAILGDWTVGYTKSTFEDPAAQPVILDPQSVNGDISDTDILVRWMHTFHPKLTVAASVEMPNGEDAVATDYYSAVKQSVPSVASFLQYQWGSGQHVRVAGIMRFLRYRDLVESRNRTVVGWGIKASSIYTPCSGPVTLYLSAFYGNGIAGITHDLHGKKLDLTGDPLTDGRMYAPAVFGYYGAVQYNFTPSLFATAAVSEERLLPSHQVSGDTYRYGLFSAFNLCWYITPRVMLGAEVDLGKHKVFSGQSAWGHRAGLTAQMTF